MVSDLLRGEIPSRNDPHDWNSWDHYRTIHDIRLSEHPFVASFQDTLAFTLLEDEGILFLEGRVFCLKDVILEVGKEFDLSRAGNTLRVRCHTYRYVAWLPGEHLLLKYHNLHRDSNEYHHRIYEPNTGEEIAHEILKRYQFPLFSEVLDELQTLVSDR